MDSAAMAITAQVQYNLANQCYSAPLQLPAERARGRTAAASRLLSVSMFVGTGEHGLLVPLSKASVSKEPDGFSLGRLW